MAEVGNIFVRIGASIDEFEKNMRQIEKQLDSVEQRFEGTKTIGEKLADVGGKLTVGLTLPLTAAAGASVKAAADFESMGYTFQAVSGATADQMERMSQLAKELGNDITLPGTSATDAAAAMTELVKAGLSIDDTFKAAKATLQLSAAAQIENAEAATIVGQALNSFGLSGDKAIMVADLLANSANASAGEITDMAYALQAGGSVAAMAGQSINDFTTAIALMANAGIVGSDAGTSLKSMLMSLMSPTDKAAKLMQELGIQIYDANGKMLPLPQLIEQFSSKLGGMSQEQRNAALATIFGSDAIRAANIVLMAGTDNWNKMSEAVNKSGGAQDVAASKMQGFNGALESFKSTVETLAITIGEKLLPILTPIIQKITEWIDRFSALSPTTQTVIMAIAGFIAVLGPIILLVGKFMSALVSIKAGLAMFGIGVTAAGGAAGAAAGSVSLLGTVFSLLTGPIGIAIAAITAAIAIGVLLYKNWDQISAWLGQAWETIKQTAINVWNSIANFFAGLWSGITNGVQSAWNGIKNFLVGLWNGIKTVATTVWTSISTFFSTIWNGIKTVATSVWNAIAGFLSSVWNGIKTTASAIWNAISSFLSTVWNNIKAVATSIWNAISTFFSTTWNTIQSVATTIWNAIKTFLSTIWNGIKGIAATLWNSILSFFEKTFNNIKNIATTIWNAIKTFLSSIWDGIKNIATIVWNSILSFFNTMLNNTKNIVTTIWNNIKNFLTNTWNTIKNIATTVWNSIKKFMTATWNAIKTVATTVWNGIKNSLNSIWNNIKNIASTLWNTIKNTITNLFNTTKNTVVNIANTLWNKITETWNGILNTIKGLISSLWNAIVEPFNIAKDKVFDIIKDAYNWGKNLIGNVIDGIKSMISKVRNTVRNVASTIKSYLGFSSPTEEGPGSDADKWMPNMMNMFNEGIQKNIPKLQATLNTAFNIPSSITQPNMPVFEPELANLGNMTSSNQPVTMIIELDGRVIAQKTVEHMPRVLRLKGAVS